MSRRLTVPSPHVMLETLPCFSNGNESQIVFPFFIIWVRHEHRQVIIYSYSIRVAIKINVTTLAADRAFQTRIS